MTATPYAILPEIAMRRVTATILALIGLFAPAARLAAAEPDTVAFTEPKEAGIAYDLQGEYVGKHNSDEGTRRSPFKSSQWVTGSFDLWPMLVDCPATVGRAGMRDIAATES
jgi:hypothetical protein